MSGLLTPQDLFAKLRLQWLSDYLYEDITLKEQIQAEFKGIFDSSEKALAYKWNGIYYKKHILNNASAPLEARWLGPEIGYGLFALSFLPSQSFIGTYLGKIRRKSPFNNAFINSYSFTFPIQPGHWLKGWGWGWTIDALMQGNHTRFINHGDKGNCESTGAICQNQIYIIIRAKRDIQAGEQILYDYGQGYWSKRDSPHLLQ
jgi:SET domain-containing protein